jgi:hypothetical protein
MTTTKTAPIAPSVPLAPQSRLGSRRAIAAARTLLPACALVALPTLAGAALSARTAPSPGPARSALRLAPVLSPTGIGLAASGRF